jgi:hypothetical protein
MSLSLLIDPLICLIVGCQAVAMANARCGVSRLPCVVQFGTTRHHFLAPKRFVKLLLGAFAIIVVRLLLRSHFTDDQHSLALHQLVRYSFESTRGGNDDASLFRFLFLLVSITRSPSLGHAMAISGGPRGVPFHRRSSQSLTSGPQTDKPSSRIAWHFLDS